MTRMHVRTIRTAAATALLAMIAAGCSTGNGGATPLTTPSATTPTPSSSPTPSTTRTLTPQEQATAQATEALKRYSAAEDQMSQKPSTFTPERAKTIAISSALTDLTNTMNVFKAGGLHSVGEGRTVSMSVESVDLKFQPKVTPPDIPVVIFKVCYDRGAVDVVDKNGKSQVPANRKPRVLLRYGVANYSWPATDGWRVAFIDGKEQACTS
jgi:hypothetical protein